MIQVTGLQAEDTYEGIVAAIKKAAQIEDAGTTEIELEDVQNEKYPPAR